MNPGEEPASVGKVPPCDVAHTAALRDSALLRRGGDVPRLLIQLTKRADGGAVLRCTRGDGSVTWQKLHGRQAAFFPLHDVTHYAVETELGFTRGFYGLIALGWDIDETTGKSARGPLPNGAIVVEYLVGQFDLERASGVRWTAAELNAHAAGHFSQRNQPAPRALDDVDLARVRRSLRELYARWCSLRAGETLELEFHVER